ncbi:hypothetical protein ACFCY8_38585 [Streptomyces noursei]
MLIELFKGVTLGLAVGLVLCGPVIVAAFFYQRSQRRKKTQ